MLILLFQEINLPQGWRKTLDQADQAWISKSLFGVNKQGQPELLNEALKLYLYPPMPPNVANAPPRPSLYFARRLCLWFPYKLWSVRLHCTQPECSKPQLTGAGVYGVVRKVLDIDDFYYMAGEKLDCPACGKRYISWSSSIVDQLDAGHRWQFPAIITYK